MTDVLVAGGGVIGLATALRAEAAGLEVAVVEPRSTPIDKACGEGLMPGAVESLRDLGVSPAGHELHGIRYVSGDRHADARFRGRHGLGVRRTDLHEALREQVDARGIPVHVGAVTDVRQSADRVSAAGITARYLVAADGLHSPLRHHLGLAVTAKNRPVRWGLRQHFATAPWTDFVEVHWSPRSEAYVTPVAADQVGVAILTTQRAPYDVQLREFPALVARLDGAASVSSVRGAGPLRQTSHARVSGRVLLVGDASGYVDALTGEGIAVGLASARALVDCISRDAPADYEQAWLRASRRYRLITETLLRASAHPLTRRSIVPAAATLSPVFRLLVDQLAR